MYCYIYDSFLNNKKYEKNIIKIENRVTDLGINGQTHKLSVLKNLSEIVRDEINSGTTTIVAIGNDKTFSQIIDVVADKKVTLGIIPVGPNNNIADSIGITTSNAIESLSKRIVKKLDLGKANDTFFISSLRIINTNCTIEHGGYKISPRFDFYNIDIYNFVLGQQKPIGNFSKSAFNPTDGVLDAIIYNPGKTSVVERLFGKKDVSINTFLPFKKLKIKKPASAKNQETETEEVEAVVDGEKIIKTPIVIEVVKNCLKIIVGKDRNF